MSVPAAAFSGTLLAPVSEAGNTGGVFSATTLMATVMVALAPDVSVAVTVTT